MNARKLVAPLLGSVAWAVFLGFACYRRLNFDESLALRAGWLDLAGLPSAPAFLMPWTLLAGAVGHALADPGAVFLLLRVLAAGGVAAAFVVAGRALRLSGAELAMASWLAVANGSFLTHALEFRYDAAVLILLLLTVRYLVEERGRIVLGALVAILAFHHLKGAFYAAGVVALSLLFVERRRRALGEMALGMGLATAAWLALAACLGLFYRTVASVKSFLSFASGAHRAPVGEALGPVLLADLGWWLAVLVAVAVGVLGRRAGEDGRREVIVIALATLGVVFWVLHPHAWAYLAALPVPFLSLAVMRSLRQRPRVAWWSAIALLLGVSLQAVATSSPPLSNVPRALSAPAGPEIALLRGLREAQQPEDRILDPSGIVYFVPPCTEEWYLDTLFVERIAEGTWMQELENGVPSGCALALNTYRLNALPRAARIDLGQRFVRLASGLVVRRDRAGYELLSELPGTGRVESFW